MSSEAQSSKITPPAESSNTTSSTPLLLPSTSESLSPSTPASSSRGGSTTQITVGGEAISLVDELGPTVVNTNGTLSRISNWVDMTMEERERTIRVLGKRNKLKLQNEEEKLRDSGSELK